MASMKFSTSRMDFSAFHTIQNTMASTFTGTVSRVSVDSAETLATRTRWSTYGLSVSTIGNDVAQSRPAQADVAAQAQDRNLFPLAHDLDREQEIQRRPSAPEMAGAVLMNGLGDGESRQRCRRRTATERPR